MTEEFFEGLRRSFGESCAKSPPRETLLSVAGRTISFRTSGGALPVTEALMHLPSGAGVSPDLAVMAWDSEQVRPSWSWGKGLRRGEIPNMTSGRFLVTFDADSGTLSALDRDRSEAFFWTRETAALPAYELATPFKTILHWWASGRRMQLVHAAAVGSPSGGILLVGRGGSGKSTSALSCLVSGMSYVSDDYCLVSSSGLPQAWSLYGTGKLDRRSLGDLPSLEQHVINPWFGSHEKGIVFLRKAFSPQLVDGFPLRAVVVPVIVPGALFCVDLPATKAEALLAMAPSTIFQLPTAGKETFRLLSDLTSSLPCKKLVVGDASGVPGVVARLVR